MKLAFVGLGQMGRHMAANLAGGEDELLAVDRNLDRFPDLQARGARTSTVVGDVVEADIIFLCLPSAEAVTGVLLAEGGIADRLKPGQIVVDTSTITYGATVELSKALEVRGIRFIDAPVSGMEARARDASLTIMCGGDEATFALIEPYLARMGNNVLFMGPPGSGQLTKLINQLLFDINAAALAEILPWR